MMVSCPKCQYRYDDAERLTFCPHGPFVSRVQLEQKKRAIDLLGKSVRFVHQKSDGPVYRVQSINWEGLVTLDVLPGEFSPFLFVVVEE